MKSPSGQSPLTGQVQPAIVREASRRGPPDPVSMEQWSMMKHCPLHKASDQSKLPSSIYKPPTSEEDQSSPVPHKGLTSNGLQ